MKFLSIDQNCSPLWDAIPKLAALRHHGFAGVHCIEDVDVAFTQQFAQPDTPPHVAPERIYPNGNSDWGASAFYTDFLGRNPLNPRTLEPYLHAPIATFAKRAGMTLDELFATFASSDNYQIIAPSYAGENHHRTLGDLTLREMREPFMALFQHAHADTRRAFPSAESREHTDAFFTAEENFLNDFFHDHPAAMLTDLYAAWMKRHLPWQEVRLATTQLASDPPTLLNAFVQNYETLAPLYNQAIAETNSGLTPLNLEKGDLPFFAVCEEKGRQFRTPLRLKNGAAARGDARPPSAMFQVELLNMEGERPREPISRHIDLLLQHCVDAGNKILRGEAKLLAQILERRGRAKRVKREVARGVALPPKRRTGLDRETAVAQGRQDGVFVILCLLFKQFH